MIYKKILNRKYSLWLQGLSAVLTMAFIMTMCSCQSTYEANYSPEKFEKLEEPAQQEILQITTKDSVFSTPKYTMNYVSAVKAMSSYFQLVRIDTVVVKTSEKRTLKQIKDIRDLKLSEIKYIKVEQSEFHFGKTMLYVGIGAAAVAIIWAVLGAIMMEKTMNAGVNSFWQ